MFPWCLSIGMSDSLVGNYCSKVIETALK
jgi:hypothetical protein